MNEQSKVIIAFSLLLIFGILVFTQSSDILTMSHFDTEENIINYDGTWINGYIPKYLNEPMILEWEIGGYSGPLAFDWVFSVTIQSPSGKTYSAEYECQRSADEYYLGGESYKITTDFGSVFDEKGKWDITSAVLTAKVQHIVDDTTYNEEETVDEITDGTDAIAVDTSKEAEIIEFDVQPRIIYDGDQATISYEIKNIGGEVTTICYRIFCDKNMDYKYQGTERKLVDLYMEDVSIGSGPSGETTKPLYYDDAVNGKIYVTLELLAYSETQKLLGDFRTYDIVEVTAMEEQDETDETEEWVGGEQPEGEPETPEQDSNHTLIIQTTPADCTITIGSQMKKSISQPNKVNTGIAIFRKEQGQYTINVDKDGYQPMSTTISVTQDTRLKFDLNTQEISETPGFELGLFVFSFIGVIYIFFKKKKRG